MFHKAKEDKTEEKEQELYVFTDKMKVQTINPQPVFYDREQDKKERE